MVQFRYPASPLWRRLYSTRCTAEPRIRWLIRSGNSSFWYDCWLKSTPLFHFNPSVASMAPISSFWCGVDWDKGKLLSVLPSLVVEQILLVPISGTGPDILRLAIFRDENFSLMNNWEFVHGSRSQNEVFSLIWQRHIPSQVSFFLWRLLNGFLATDDA